MEIAILSDIHSNIHGLEAVWKDFNCVRPDEIYCLGDLVECGVYPNDAIDFVRKNNIPTVIGNYDDAVDKPKDSEYRAGYVAFMSEIDRTSMEYRRIDYNVNEAAQAVRNNEFPEQFASQLESSR
jgi:predicted phosphodiesterase